MSLDWTDIAIHGGVALAWGVLCGVGYHFGYPPLAIMVLAAGGAFWFFRERLQHGGESRFHLLSQSMWEWIAPNVLAVAAFIATITVL